MGNCLVLQEKPLNEMKTDENIIIDYKSQIIVHQKLPIFSHHEISSKHVHPNSQYLFPLPQPTKKTEPVGYSDDVSEEQRRADGVVRVKLVLSKHELQAMLGEDGVSVENTSSKVQTEELITNKIASIGRGMSCKGWLPVLESIPEVN